MESNAPPNSPEKPAKSGILYYATVVILICVIVVSAVFLGRNVFGQKEASSNPSVSQDLGKPTGQTNIPTKPTQSTNGATQDKPTDPTAGTMQTKPTDPTVNTAPTNPTDTLPSKNPNKVELEISAFSEPIWLISEAAKDYLTAERVPFVAEFMRPYLASGLRQDIGLPVEIGYNIIAMPLDCGIVSVEFYLSESESFANAQILRPAHGETSVKVYGLYTGKQYYCGARIVLSNGETQELYSSFQTAATPRILYIDGIVNVRDIGGWQAADGALIRQGLLYRGSELDGFVKPEYKLTEKGQNQLFQELGIRMDMDLRYEGEDALGTSVKHTYYDVLQYSSVFTTAGSTAIRAVFRDLANPENYPVYLHCTYGADRTGTVCYLLEALLGVSDADLIRDYELSALTYGFVSRELMDPFIEQIGTYPGDNTQQKVEAFLLSIGVTEEEIISIRHIFLS